MPPDVLVTLGFPLSPPGPEPAQRYTDHHSINLVFGRVGLGIRRMNLGNEALQETGDVYLQLAI